MIDLTSLVVSTPALTIRSDGLSIKSFIADDDEDDDNDGSTLTPQFNSVFFPISVCKVLQYYMGFICLNYEFLFPVSLYLVASDLTSASIFLIAQPCFVLVNSPLPPQVAAPLPSGSGTIITAFDCLQIERRSV